MIRKKFSWYNSKNIEKWKNENQQNELIPEDSSCSSAIFSIVRIGNWYTFHSFQNCYVGVDVGSVVPVVPYGSLWRIEIQFREGRTWSLTIFSIKKNLIWVVLKHLETSSPEEKCNATTSHHTTDKIRILAISRQFKRFFSTVFLAVTRLIVFIT